MSWFPGVRELRHEGSVCQRTGSISERATSPATGYALSATTNHSEPRRSSVLLYIELELGTASSLQTLLGFSAAGPPHAPHTLRAEMILRARLNALLDSALCSRNCSAQPIATGCGNMALSRGHIHDIRPSRPHASAFEEELDKISQVCTDYNRATVDQFLDSLRQAARDAGFYQARGAQPVGSRWYPDRLAEHGAVLTELRVVPRDLATRRECTIPPGLQHYLVC